jgi:poly-beta-1,6-N-acetyl-D-glucosamine synthase
LIVYAITILVGLVFLVFYLLYFSICFKYRKKTVDDKSFAFDSLPNVSVIVPAYNEVDIIEKKIDNLSKTNYLKNRLEVVFVDGGSNDGTIEEIQKLICKVDFKAKVIEQGSRKGFNAAVIDGFYASTGDIIVITGAETQYEPDALRIMVNHFADQRIGAVNGVMKVSNFGEGLSTQLETAYRGLYDFLRLAESNIDSPFDIKGEIAAVRRSICQHIIENPRMTRKGCIDACVSFQAKLDGYRTLYDSSAVYYEPAPKTMRDSFRQQVRRGATLIENMLVFKSIMFKRKYGLFGTLIMPAHFFMLIVMPFLFFITIGGLILIVILNPTNYLFAALFLVVGLSAVLSRRVQAFIKTQTALIGASIKMLRGIETQKFDRLASVRPEKKPRNE